MRLTRLDLAAFGPFTDKQLDLSGGSPGGLHLIYGKNAAGKSSALRAISDLLFGIPPKSGDDHVHPYQSMRLRAELESSAGERLFFQRLKRNKDSLRDEHDAPLDDLALRRLLGGVDRALFERVFGLDHERLADAGKRLLEGGGDVGESLFDAGAGGQGVHRVLLRLREEAERLFKPRGGKQEIPQLLDGYRAAQKRAREAANSPEAYQEQLLALERHRVEGEEAARKLSELRREREHCRLLQGALRSLKEREQLLARLAELGTLPDLPSGFSERRERVQASLTAHESNLTRLELELGKLQQRIGELRPPGSLLAIDATTIEALREGVGSTKKALNDLPSREATLVEQRAAAQALERRLGVDPTRLTSDALRARRPAESRFRKLLADRGAALVRARLASDGLSQAELEQEVAAARLSALPRPGDVHALEQAVSFARHAGDVEGTLRTVRTERAEAELASDAELAMLAPFDGSLEDLCRLRLPLAETIARYEQGFVELEARARRLDDAAGRVRERAAELERELSAEDQTGAVPSEDELERQRGRRDELFDALWKARPEKAGKALPLFEAAQLRDYRAAVATADTLADRLRREAARVADSARRRAEHAQLGAEQARLVEERTALAADRAELEQAWAASWAEAGLVPVRPAEMRAWLARREHAVGLVQKRAALARAEADATRRAAELRAAIEAALGALEPGTPLAAAVKLAEERLDAERAVLAERRSLEQRLAEVEARRTAAQRSAAAADKDLAELDRQLVQVIAELGFEPALSPEEVEARLGDLADLLGAREKTTELERRIAGMQRDIAAFTAEVRALVAEHAPDLTDTPAQRAAAELVSRAERAHRDAELLAALQQELADKSAQRDGEQTLLATAEREAAALRELAGVTSLEALPQLEDRVASARELRGRVATLDATLAATAGGRDLPSLLAEAAATDAAQLSARIEELGEAIEQLEDERAQSIRSHQSAQAGIENFTRTNAVEAAQEERALASALIARSERWARFKLAEVLLAREIERYREQNQGPVLRRASELFAELTQGAYRTLRVGREERTLVAVRASDHEVTVEGLNEAARYHLYLALRLASIERYLEHAEPLPLVLDDVLIHFDEEGARAALGVLGRFAERLQVLLFTHHRHNLDLAARSVPAARLHVHEL